MTSEWFVTGWCLFFYIFENIILKHEMALSPVRCFCNEKQNSTVSWGSVETGSPIHTPYPLSFSFCGEHTHTVRTLKLNQILKNTQVWRDLLWNFIFDYMCAYYLLLMVKTFDVFVCCAAGCSWKCWVSMWWWRMIGYQNSSVQQTFHSFTVVIILSCWLCGDLLL